MLKSLTWKVIVILKQCASQINSEFNYDKKLIKGPLIFQRSNIFVISYRKRSWHYSESPINKLRISTILETIVFRYFLKVHWTDLLILTYVWHFCIIKPRPSYILLLYRYVSCFNPKIHGLFGKLNTWGGADFAHFGKT